ncbi:MAG TPA: hypothetical protein VNO82_15080 [Solirubrobacteraceae bacterium]|nr:hypothetical protein [Solirubrobacteraceae bacterium]
MTTSTGMDRGLRRNGRLRLVATLAAVVALAVVSGCSDSSSDDRPAASASVATARPAQTFAPLVHLYEKEPARPIDTEVFIANSSLTMANNKCSQETIAIGLPRLRLKRDEPAPVLDANRLNGPRPYRQRMRTTNCRGHEQRAYTTTEHTAPYDSGRSKELLPHEGFYLDLLTERHLGTAKYPRNAAGQLEVAAAPVYYERRAEQVDGGPGLRITYWMLFGIDGYPGQSEKAYALNSEGDWERVSVLLRRGDRPDSWEPVSVGYRIHGRNRDIPWDDVKAVPAGGERAATHPVVYAAQGNHAPYPDAGRAMVTHRIEGVRKSIRFPDVRRSCADCPRWSTWEDLVLAKREPWYGYGGNWGAMGTTAHSSGSIGPSPFSR